MRQDKRSVAWALAVAYVVAFCQATPLDEAEAAQARKSREEAAALLQERAAKLYEAWSDDYGLSMTHPPPSPPGGRHSPGVPTPRAPHLLSCRKRASLHAELEAFGADGEPPPWTRDSPCPSCGPHTPWVRGADVDNLPLTCVVQRDLFLRQLAPGSCGPRRLLAVSWEPRSNFGMGAQLHVMSAALSLALAHNRTLVPMPGTYLRANHGGCAAMNQSGSLSCYFAPVVSRSCEEAAVEAVQAGEAVVATKHDLLEHLPSPWRVVYVGPGFGWSFRFKHQADVASRWGEPWLGHGEQMRRSTWNVRHKGLPPGILKVSWWRAQSVRFMLRWPTAYLCHLINRARHETYGLAVARSIVGASEQQLGIARDREGAATVAADGETGQFAEDAKVLQSARSSEGFLEEAEEEEDVLREAYIARPIVSMHVRQGDKGGEMQLLSFNAFMWFAFALRRKAPDLANVWLSTEMENVVDSVTQHPTWNFMFTKNLRQRGRTAVHVYENQVGVETLAGLSFANLMIASECDFFIATLGSNWNRLINELRLTNGRANAWSIALNYEQW